MIVRLFIPILSRKLANLYCWIALYIFGKATPMRIKPILFKNMEAHHSNNMKIGFTFIGVVGFLMLVMTSSIGITGMAETSI